MVDRYTFISAIRWLIPSGKFRSAGCSVQRVATLVLEDHLRFSVTKWHKNVSQSVAL